MYRAELGEVFRAEGPRPTPARQCLNHLGLQHADFQANRGRLRVVQLLSEPPEACPHETDPSFDFEGEVSAFVDNAALTQELSRLSIPLTSCFDDERWSQGCLLLCS